MDFSAEGILARMKNNLKNEDTKMEGSFSMDNLQAVAEEMARFNGMRIIPLMSELEERESDMGTSGNERHYIQWAKEAENTAGEKVVGNAKVSSPRDKTGNVFIAIVSVSAAAPTEEEIRIVQEYIDNKRPVGANPMVSAAVGIPVKIACTLQADAGYTKETIANALRNKIQEYFTAIAFQSGLSMLNYYNICNLATDTEGVKELEILTVNDSRDSIAADYDKYFSFEELVVNVIDE